jgi:endo-1,4-beta-xylanase
MKMSYLHPTEILYTYDDADAMITWADTNGLSVHGHALIWHSDYQVPDWMKTYGGDFETMLNTHVTDIATYFADKVVSWDVVNEGIDESQGDCYRRSLFYNEVGGPSYIANAFAAARAADPDVDLYYNDYDIEGGNPAKLNCLLQIV